MTFYLLYVLLITILLLVNYFYNDSNGLFELFAYFVIIMISGLRYYTGYDYDMYTHIYNDKIFDSFQEFGFLFLINTLRFIGLSAPYMFFLISLFTFVFLYLGIKKITKHSGIALIVFMLIPGLYLNTLSIIRQELAIVISLYAFSALIEKKFMKYFLLMFLGFSFHYSCILTLFAQLIAWKFSDKIKLSHYYLAIIFSFIVAKLNITSFLSLFLVGLKYEVYLEGESVSFFKIIVLNVFIFIQLFYYKKLAKQNSYNKYVIFFTVMSIFLINCFSSLLIITRIAYYFRIFEVILVAEFVYVFINIRYRIFSLSLLYTYYLSMFIYALQNDVAADGQGVSKMIPYKNILFTN